MEQHSAPWWYTLAARYFPSRCREIPEATQPERIVLRQFALWKRHVYLQQFASSESFDWMHSHQWRRTFALGLWGNYFERRLAGYGRCAGNIRERSAPYCYTMGAEVIHQVVCPSAGHTSLFVGLWRDDDLKHYYPADCAVEWEDHIQVMVERI